MIYRALNEKEEETKQKVNSCVVHSAPTNKYDVITSAIFTGGSLGFCWFIYKLLTMDSNKEHPHKEKEYEKEVYEND